MNLSDYQSTPESSAICAAGKVCPKLGHTAGQ